MAAAEEKKVSEPVRAGELAFLELGQWTAPRARFANMSSQVAEPRSVVRAVLRPPPVSRRLEGTVGALRLGLAGHRTAI